MMNKFDIKIEELSDNFYKEPVMKNLSQSHEKYPGIKNL